ncbi:hypothetical protein HKK52_12890 [Pseudomonas sp. ADAK2]|uniref:hypothetical protein n=1 Tax=Pseudomonas TaxID=286 RepID=UPI0014640BB7|nr:MULTISPECIES: hypothetical protein [unclassified Pseudomonas]QJI41775.1 hypothetical protein HKK53_12890 [Pseudomonas sp. ADAK7]QJI48079.1 hypothetical protein HKK52_12890 [Pseudomonas sp. ADAK2]
MKKISSAIALTFLTLGLFQGSAFAMSINEHINIEMAKIDFEFNCTVEGNVTTHFANNEESAKAQAVAQGLGSSNATYQVLAKTAVCVKPKYKYDCMLPSNKNIPLSGSLSYSYWTNQPTLENFKNSENGKKLLGCQAPWW